MRDNAQLDAHLASLSALGRVGLPDNVGAQCYALNARYTPVCPTPLHAASSKWLTDCRGVAG